MILVKCALSLMLANGAVDVVELKGKLIDDSGDYWTVDFTETMANKYLHFSNQIKTLNSNFCLIVKEGDK